MEKFWRFCRWLRLALVVLLVLGVVGLAFYTHTDGFRELVRQKLVTAINDSIHGKVSLARLDGSVWGNLTLIDVRLVDNEAEIARIPRLKVNYALLPLIWGRIQVFRLEATQPLMWLKEGRDGIWNIVAALAPVEPESETPSLTVSISSLELQKSDIDVSFSGRSYRLTGLDLQGTAGIRPDVTTVDVRQVSSRLLAKGIPEVRVKGALAYEDSGGRESLKFSDFFIESGSSGLRLTGKIDDLKTLRRKPNCPSTNWRLADIAHFVPQWPVKANVSGNGQSPRTAHGAERRFHPWRMAFKVTFRRT
jgi:autotransporter translocation and assembly factor TamB